MNIIDCMELSNRIGRIINSSEFNTTLVVVSMLFIPLSELFGELIYNVPFVFERSYLTFLGFAGIGIFILNIFINKKFDFLTIVYLLLIFFAGISVAFSKPTQPIPFFIITGHIEEVFHYYAYFFLFYASTKIEMSKDVKFVILTFIVIGIIHNFFGVFQLFGLRISDDSYNNKEMHEQLKCIYGLTSNCNFYAGLATIITSITCATYLVKKIPIFDYKWIFLIFVMFFCTICSSTRLGILGVAATLFFLISLGIITFLLKKNIFLKNAGWPKLNLNKITLIIAISIISFFIVYVAFPQLLIPSLNEFSNDVHDLSSTKNIDNFGSLRGQVWRFSIEYLLKVNFLTGTGIGNFIDVFLTNPRMHESPQIVNFAHNEYLHILVTQGIFAFATYMTLYTTCIARSIKSILYSGNETFKQFKIIIVLTLLCYMTQAFFNCNIFETYLYFWILLGLSYSNKQS